MIGDVVFNLLGIKVDLQRSDAALLGRVFVAKIQSLRLTRTDDLAIVVATHTDKLAETPQLIEAQKDVLALLVARVRIVGSVVVLAVVGHVVVVEIEAVDELRRLGVVGDKRLFPIDDEVLVAIDIRDVIDVFVEAGIDHGVGEARIERARLGDGRVVGVLVGEAIVIVVVLVNRELLGHRLDAGARRFLTIDVEGHTATVGVVAASVVGLHAIDLTAQGQAASQVLDALEPPGPGARTTPLARVVADGENKILHIVRELAAQFQSDQLGLGIDRGQALTGGQTIVKRDHAAVGPGAIAAVGAVDGVVDLLVLFGVPFERTPRRNLRGSPALGRPGHLGNLGALPADIEHVVSLANAEAIIAGHVGDEARRVDRDVGGQHKGVNHRHPALGFQPPIGADNTALGRTGFQRRVVVRIVVETGQPHPLAILLALYHNIHAV